MHDRTGVRTTDRSSHASYKALAAEGATIALCDINEAAVKTGCSELGGEHQFYALDVGSSQQCNEIVARIVGHFGRIDGLFNCAGVNPTESPLAETTDEYWDKLVSTNLRGPYNMTRACIPHLQTGGVIVNVSSTAGIRASAGFAIYNATKFGVIGFSKSMALELGPKGIRVNVIAPGPIDTPTNASVMEGEDAVRRIEQRISMGRLGKPDEVADVVTFLFSEKSRWVNGAVIEVTGGM